MTDREKFEKIYPMPEFMSWDESDGDYFLSETPNSDCVYYHFTGAWFGWRAGKESAQELS